MSDPAEDATERRRSILVVEDDLFIGLELKACLEVAGFLVLGPAGSVRDALRLISTQRPDAAVLDVNLGRENVIPVAQQLNLLDVPHVIASAADAAELAQYGALAGARSIGKPTDLKVLANSILALTVQLRLAGGELPLKTGQRQPNWQRQNFIERRIAMLADVYFSVPLQVSFPNGVTRSFESVHDTVDFLENEWPLRHGERYRRALEKCRAALYRMTPVAVAREAFVAGCLEAGLPVQGGPPAWHRSGPMSPPRMSA